MTLKNYKTITAILIFINSIGALVGGGNLIKDPSGSGIQLSLHWLDHTPFDNYLIPGLILFTVNGLFGLFVLIMMLFQYKQYPFYVILQGILLGGWIVVQMLLIRTVHPFHTFFLFVAFCLLVLGLIQQHRISIDKN